MSADQPFSVVKRVSAGWGTALSGDRMAYPDEVRRYPGGVTPLHRTALAAAALIALITPAIATLGSAHSAPRVLAGCNDTIDTTDSFSMNCVPTVIPDMSDQLTEAEVAEPGWNAIPGGAGGGAHR